MLHQAPSGCAPVGDEATVAPIHDGFEMARG